MPTFETALSDDKLKVTAEGPDAQVIEGKQLLYIFVVDRSGSMGTEHRMDITKMALKLFVKSLPLGSKFSILSFGSRCEFMHRVTSKLFNTMSDIFEYNDETLEDVL